MNKQDLELTEHDERQNEEDYFKDKENCAEHHMAEEILKKLPDRVLISLLMKTCSDRGYRVSIKWGA